MRAADTGPMTIVLDQVRSLAGHVLPHGPRCLVCGRVVRAGEPEVRLRGDGHVHRGCATYRMRRRPEGADRLGYPRRG